MMLKTCLRYALLCALPLFGTACATVSKHNPVYLIKVDRGDTVAMIARKYDTTAEAILDLNGLESGTAPRVGQVLRVAPGPAGRVAGAESAPKASGPRLAKKVPAGSAADDAEFTEDDIPSDDGRTTRPAAKKGGLFFNGGASGADGAFFRWPVQGPLGSLFGMRHGRPHKGIDIRARYGSDIVAAGPGVVEFAGRQNGYGRVVFVRHGKWRTVYGHLSSIDVSVGDHVDRTTVLGQVGTSGNASGPHLHFEVKNRSGTHVDPMGVLGGSRLLSKN